MLFTEGDSKVILSSLMWSAGVHFQAADVAAQLGHIKLAGEKADFAKECKKHFDMFRAGGKIVLDDAAGVIVRAALQWAAMEHEKAAKGATPADAKKRGAFAGECARLADMFQKGH